MATPKAAWGIEIGAYAIKAIRLERDGNDVTVSDFAVIPQKKVLTTPDLDQDEIVRLGLGQFISQKSLEGEHLVMSVPGHTAFARFAKLPPVEPKKVPDIVKFEAVQQIPFPIDEVEWDYQTFTSPDTPEIEVGIFAITRERVQQRLGLYSELGVTPEAMTLSPVAVYNAMAFDHGKRDGAVIYLDIGTSATDVIIAEKGRCWIRTFPLGGTHFTEAIANAFKLSYSKAEKLKLEASDSKYAKQIMQAMRPVFSDLLQDLQRSIGYYQSLHRESELNLMVGIGSTFKIPGLRKFLGQQLQIDVVRLDEYKKIHVKGREAASFAENAVNMATAYGLALQGVGLGQIDANLVPVQALRESMWRAKTKWFAAAAAVAIIAAGVLLVRPMYDRSRMAPMAPPEVANVIGRATDLKQQYETLRASADVGAAATNMLDLLDYRTVWPYLLHDSASALASSQPQPELLSDDLDLILGVDPKDRRLVQLQQLVGGYVVPVEGTNGRRIQVTMNVELSHSDPVGFLNSTVAKWLRDNAEPKGARAEVPYRIIATSVMPLGEALEAIEVTPEGEKAAPAADPGRGGAATPPSPGVPPRAGTPRQPGRGGRGGSMNEGGGGAASGAGGLRQGPAGQQQAPGTGISADSSGGDRRGGGTGNAPRIPTTPTATPGAVPGGNFPIPSPPALGEARDLNETAPIPPRPGLYPSGSTYYRIPITFEVELIDAAPAPAATAGAAAPEATS